MYQLKMLSERFTRTLELFTLLRPRCWWRPESGGPGAGRGAATLRGLLHELAHDGVRLRHPLFDSAYYVRRYPDVRRSNLPPLLHYVLYGGAELRQPHPLFDAAFYNRCYPGAVSAGVSPLLDYLRRGGDGRRPHPLFDAAFYLERYPDVAAARVNPLLHYVVSGAAEGRKPHPLFDPDYYRTCCPAASPGSDALIHFLECGAKCANPHPLFDCRAYIQAHPEIAVRDMNPLVHYVLHQGSGRAVEGTSLAGRSWSDAGSPDAGCRLNWCGGRREEGAGVPPRARKPHPEWPTSRR